MSFSRHKQKRSTSSANFLCFKQSSHLCLKSSHISINRYVLLSVAVVFLSTSSSSCSRFNLHPPCHAVLCRAVPSRVLSHPIPSHPIPSHPIPSRPTPSRPVSCRFRRRTSSVLTPAGLPLPVDRPGGGISSWTVTTPGQTRLFITATWWHRRTSTSGTGQTESPVLDRRPLQARTDQNHRC